MPFPFDTVQVVTVRETADPQRVVVAEGYGQPDLNNYVTELELDLAVNTTVILAVDAATDLHSMRLIFENGLT